MSVTQFNELEYVEFSAAFIHQRFVLHKGVMLKWPKTITLSEKWGHDAYLLCEKNFNNKAR